MKKESDDEPLSSEGDGESSGRRENRRDSRQEFAPLRTNCHEVYESIKMDDKDPEEERRNMWMPSIKEVSEEDPSRSQYTS